ncbi:hypothetical protein GGF32_006728 [Allomyces javanicus]|nr:hypothetical protein GGF32_006728 [Allomyces javanicus]
MAVSRASTAVLSRRQFLEPVDGARSVSEASNARLKPEQIEVIAWWNISTLLVLALFLYLASVRKIEFLERRYPLLVAIQTVAGSLWANAYFQSPSVVPWLPPGDDGPMGGAVWRFFLCTASSPLWAMTSCMRALSVIADHFTNVQMLHDSSKCCRDWTNHLTHTERVFLTVLDRVLGTRPAKNETTTSLDGCSDTDSWPMSAVTVGSSPNTSLIPGGGGGGGTLTPSLSSCGVPPAMPPSPVSTLNMRRITTRMQMKAALIAAVIGVGILVPVGMAAAQCFADPARVPSAEPYPGCLGNHVYLARKYYPMIGVLMVLMAAFPVIFWVMRGIQDQLYLRLEMMSQLVVTNALLILYFFVNVVLSENKVPYFMRSSSIVLMALVEGIIHSLLVPIVYCLWSDMTRGPSPNVRRRLSKGDALSATTVHLEMTADSLKVILQDEGLFTKFKECLSRSFCLENGLFWYDYSRLETLASLRTPPQPPTTIPAGTTTTVLLAPPLRAPSIATSDDGNLRASPSPVETALRRGLHHLYATYVVAGTARELNLSASARERVVADVKAGTLSLASFALVRDEVFQAMYTNTLPRFLADLEREGSLASSSRRSSTIVCTAIWNGLGLFFLALFLYLAYVRKVEFIKRRYPLLVAVQTLTIGSWANALFQCPSAIKWLPEGPDGPLGGHVPRFFLATTACPLWFATCTMRALSVVADHFTNVQMLHDTSRCCAVWTDHLTPTERRFLTALDWVFGTRPTAHATSSDSDAIWPVSATASPSAALLAAGGGSTAPMRTPSASALAMRRIATRMQLKAVLGATVFGLGVLVPAGLAVAKCFADAAVVPTALPYPACLSSPVYMTSKYFPLVAVLLTFIAVLPLLFVLMRGIRDPHHLWLETLSQFIVLDVVLVGYLLVSTVFAKSAPPLIAESGLVLFALVESAIHSLVIPTVFYLWKRWTESWPRNGLKRLSVSKSTTTVHLEHTTESLNYILKVRAGPGRDAVGGQ